MEQSGATFLHPTPPVFRPKSPCVAGRPHALWKSNGKAALRDEDAWPALPAYAHKNRTELARLYHQEPCRYRKGLDEREKSPPSPSGLRPDHSIDPQETPAERLAGVSWAPHRRKQQRVTVSTACQARPVANRLTRPFRISSTSVQACRQAPNSCVQQRVPKFSSFF